MTQPNILLFIADDHRFSAVGALGQEPVRTPAFDALIQNGTLWTHAFTTVPICTPARAELMTGRNAFRNGVRWFSDSMRPELPLLPQVLGGVGYHTFATGKWHNDGRPETRGFAQTNRVFKGGMFYEGQTVTLHDEDEGEVSGHATELFAQAGEKFVRSAANLDKPWFAYVSFTSPHDPREPPGRCRYNPDDVPLVPAFMPEHPFDNGEMTIRDELLEAWPRTPQAIKQHNADYYGMITHLEEQIGCVLQALEETGQAKNTVVIYMSDHGLSVGNHGLMGKENCYDHSVRVPLMMRGPGIAANRRCDALCYGFDVYATLCNLSGAPLPSDLDSRDLLAIAQGEARREAVFCAYQNSMRMARDEQWKLIFYPHLGRYQLFDLEADPHELRDLLLPWRYQQDEWQTAPPDRSPAWQEAARMREVLREFQECNDDPLRHTVELPAVML